MAFARLIVLCAVLALATHARCHRHRARHGDEDHARAFAPEAEPEAAQKSRRSLNLDEARVDVPFSARRLEKMLEKAILKIITGDLSTADMLLLKSLNYSLEEVMAIREREMGRSKDNETRKDGRAKAERKPLHAENGVRSKEVHWNRNAVQPGYEPRVDLDADAAREEERRTERIAQKTSNDNNDNDDDDEFDFDAYNRQAVVDYENLASRMESQQSRGEPVALDYEDGAREPAENEGSMENLHRNFDRAMEPHVVFKIRYDDSEFDSNSDEKSRSLVRGYTASKVPRHHRVSTSRHEVTAGTSSTANSFHEPRSSLPPSAALASRHTPLPVVYRMSGFNGVGLDHPGSGARASTEPPRPIGTTEGSPKVAPLDQDVANETSLMNGTKGTDATNEQNRTNSSVVAVTGDGNGTGSANAVEGSEKGRRRVSEYEGLEWVEDDVYRVIPAVADSLSYDSVDENETSDYEDPAGYYNRINASALGEGGENDTVEYQNDAPDVATLAATANGNGTAENASSASLSAYQQLAIAHRREGNVTSTFDSQGQKAIEDIKSRILALTGRFNLSTNANQVQRERLTMFPASCEAPRNTDQETWADPFSMNLYFQLNHTSGDHVVAAKLRLFKLPQENLTTPGSGNYEDEDEDERKIRISVYYYTKSLKKHRSKKRLMDSVVTPLTSVGTHLALDVRQALRFWKLSPRNQHGNGNNHGLVIQAEDQDGRPLKPALYVQQQECPDRDSEPKASHRLPALFVRACARYVRIVNDEAVTYVNCRL